MHIIVCKSGTGLLRKKPANKSQFPSSNQENIIPSASLKRKLQVNAVTSSIQIILQNQES